MPLKIMQPVQLDPSTKCPKCNMPINTLSAGTYVCQQGHILEPVILITIPAKPKQEPVKVASGFSEEPLTPEYKGIKQ